MNYYNSNLPMRANPMQRQQPIDPQKFKALAHNLNDSLLNQLAQRARLQGISEQDIQQGMEIIKKM